MRSLIRRFALLLAIATAPAHVAHAQESAATTAAESAPAAVQPTTDPVAGSTHGVPLARPQAERTLRPYWHVFVAFALAWALLFGYAISLGRRFARLERDLSGFAPRAE